MADKSVGELIAAQSVTPTDLFVLEQNGTAKKLTGQILENWLVSFADGHGGIQSIKKLSTSVLADTYRITLSDTTTFDFVVTNGRGITGISKTSTSGLVDTYTISYNDGTTGRFTVTNGEKDDKGDNAYIWIKYASQEPTESSHSMGDIPDNWIGIYSGNSSTAPTDWKQYQWFQIKGEKGDTGIPATILSRSVTYQVGDSGTVVPSGSWLANVPSVPQVKYLWTRTVVQFNTGDPITWYSVAYAGINGTGAVSTVAGISPDGSGNVSLSAADVGARPNTWTPTASEVGAISSTDGAVVTSNIADGAVSAGKIAAGAVTRAKLAQDALVSPLKFFSGNSYTIAAEDIGRTIMNDYTSGDNNEKTVNLTYDVSHSLPIGTVIAVARPESNIMKISFGENLRVGIPGNDNWLAAPTVSISDRFSTVALTLKSLGAQDYWLLTGYVEVVT